MRVYITAKNCSGTVLASSVNGLLVGSNIRFIGPVNLGPRVDTSKISKRTDLSLAEKIALSDNESQLSSTGPLSVQ